MVGIFHFFAKSISEGVRVMTFREKEKIIQFIFNKRRKILLLSKRVKDVSGKESSQDLFLRWVHYALKSCPKEYQRIIENEFILHEPKDWWYDYYSRSSYYRTKQKAMDAFLDCLHQ